MKRALGQWPGMLFGSQCLRIVCGLSVLLMQTPAIAQEDWSSSRAETGNLLTFQTEGNAAVTAFQIPLKKKVSTTETATLTAPDLGPITLQSSGGQTVRIEEYRWKLESSSRLYLGQSGYKSLIAIYQYGDSSQYSLRLNCRTRKEIVNCAMKGNGPLFDDDTTAKGNFNLTSGSLVSGDRSGTPSANGSANGTTTRLPRVEGINVRDVRILPSEKNADADLERAISANAGDSGQPSTETRYFYNRVDLNGDNTPETIVYLVGRSTCGTGGCKTLILQSDPGSRYRLVSEMTLMNQPIIVTENRSNRWKDLVTYVAGGGAAPGYRLLRYDGRGYPTNPSTQPSLPNPTYLSGTAVIGDRIGPETTAPILGRGTSPSWDNGAPDSDNDVPPPPNGDSASNPVGQSSGYRRGYELGQLDAKQNIIRNPARHRTEYDPTSENDFRRGYDNGYGNYSNGGSDASGSLPKPGDGEGGISDAGGDRPSATSGNQYRGQGTLIVSPTTGQGQGERYVLNRIQIEPGSQARLLLYTQNQSETIELVGQLESGFSGKSLTLSAVDGVPAQGKVLIGQNGSLRTTNPITVSSEESEISIDFRPN
jgi:hypothetical protein